MKIFVLDKFRFISIICIMLCISVFLISYLTGDAEERLLPVYSVKTDEKAVSVTFDCAWTAEDLPSICDTLKAYDCKATFFVVGSWAEKYPDSVKLLKVEGHEVAGHSYNHAHYNRLGKAELLSDIGKCDTVIKELTGETLPIFRSPYGEYNNTVVEAASSSGKTLIQWSIDSLDWKDLTKDEMMERIIPKLHNGAIILMHNGTKNTASALPSILEGIKNEGYSFKSAGDLIYKENYYIDESGRQIKNKAD